MNDDAPYFHGKGEDDLRAHLAAFMTKLRAEKQETLTPPFASSDRRAEEARQQAAGYLHCLDEIAQELGFSSAITYIDK